eukprot:COSAG06_NODE_30981_length_529_cov_0.444186_1_plen_81_part_00
MHEKVKPDAAPTPTNDQGRQVVGAEDFGEEAAAAKEVSAERKADQAAVDGAIKISDADLKLYLSKKFYLTKGQYPHTMKF